jgi:hypothetical protein
MWPKGDLVGKSSEKSCRISGQKTRESKKECLDSKGMGEKQSPTNWAENLKRMDNRAADKTSG